MSIAVSPDPSNPQHATAHTAPYGLSPLHRDSLLHGSGIANTVIDARGYFTAAKKSTLERLGFGRAQRCVPALVLPVWSITGTVELHQIRPDAPRFTKGKALKYETPAGAKMALDVSPLATSRQQLGDPQIPLWLTEGIKKRDALETYHCCAVAVLGVWNWRGTNEHGGKTLLADFEAIALADRDVFIVYDSDVMHKPEVHQALERLGAVLARRHAHVRYVSLPSGPSGSKVGVDDFLVQGNTVDALLALASSVVPPPASDRPQIEIRPDMTAVVDAAQAAILDLPGGPHLFQRARQLSIIARGVTPPGWLRRPVASPVIVPAEPSQLRERMAQGAEWVKLDKRTGILEPSLPPTWVIETLCARPSWPFPPLKSIACAPTMRPNGTILDTPGYDPSTGLYLDLAGITYPPMPIHPTIDNARTAIGQFQEVFCDFPYIEPWHWSATLAAVLSLIARFALDEGNVPLMAVTSTIRGSGKGLLIDAISMIATGRQAPRWAQTIDDDEERKRLLTLALQGDALLHIDNITHPLGSGPLDLAITAPTFSDRLLGTNSSREAPMHAVFFASANNLQYRGDLARRVLPIALDPRMERPEERTGFAHSPLLPWVQKQRPALVIAGLTILSAYFTADCPRQGVTEWGSFEAWSALIREALIWAGEDDPCRGRKDIEADSDPQYEAQAVLLEAWAQCYPANASGVPQEKTLKTVLQDIGLYAGQMQSPPRPVNEWNAWDDLRDALASLDAKADNKTLHREAISYKLREWQGRVIHGKRLVKAGEDRTKTALWSVKVL